MKKKLTLILLAVIAALCMIGFAGCDNNKPKPPAPEVTYTVTVGQSEHGSVTASATTVKEGESVTFTITPDNYYLLDTFTVNGEAVTVSGSTYTVDEVTEDITVAATFKRQTVTVSFQNATPASATVNVGGAYGDLPVVIAPDGLRFHGWFTGENGSGTEVTASTIVTNAENHTLYPYINDKCIVKFDFGTGTGSADRREITFGHALGELPAATAPAGSQFYGWFADGREVTATTEVEDDMTVKASFISVAVSLQVGSAENAVGGLGDYSTMPELLVGVLLDGKPFDEPIVLQTTDETVATVTSENKVLALKAGKVKIKALWNEIEMFVSDFEIECSVYEGYTVVEDRAGVLAIANNPAGKYAIVKDIDMDSASFMTANWLPLFGTFTGVIDGMGHKLYDINGAHPSGWDEGAFVEMRGIVKDIAFVNMRTLDGVCANNGFFGKLTGTVENVFMDITYRYTGRADSTAGWGALASVIEADGKLINCVVELHKESDADYAAAIAFNAANFLGKVENCFVIKDNAKLTDNNDGLYYKSSAADGITVAEAITENSGVFDYLVQLINSDDVDVTKLGDKWSVVDGSLYFFGRKIMQATPEYIIIPSGNVDYSFEDEETTQYSVRLIHNGEETNEVPENIEFASSDPSIATLEYDEDYGFILTCKAAGRTNITIKIGDCTATFYVALQAEIHIKTAQEFLDKIGNNPSGIFVIDNDLDFGDRLVQAYRWSSVANFTGSIDGQGHLLKNARLKGDWNGGLISYFDGTIKNVGFVNFSIDGNETPWGGIFEMVQNGATVENVFIDWVVTNADTTSNPFGALTGDFVEATAENIVIVARPGEGIDPATIRKFGLLAGKLTQSPTIKNVKALAYGFGWTDATLFTTNSAAGGAIIENCEAYVDFATMLASDLTSFEGELWTIDQTGIHFGETCVFAIPEFTIVPERANVSFEGDTIADIAAAELGVDVYCYLTKYDELPDGFTAEISDEDVATVAVENGKIVVTPVGFGTAVITLKMGDEEVTVNVKIALPAVVDFEYDGETELDLDYEIAGKKVATTITAVSEGEEVDIPDVGVTYTSTDEAVAKFVYNETTGKIDIQLDGEGTATLTAKKGNGQSVTITVNVIEVTYISTAAEFLTKINADPAGYFVLTDDINCRDAEGGWIKVNGWDPMCGHPNVFTGTIDGKGHTMSGGYLMGNWNGGMMYAMEGTIKNIAFIDFTMEDALMYGGLFELVQNGGRLENVYIDYVYSHAPTTNPFGALAGQIAACTINNVIINLRIKGGVEIDPANFCVVARDLLANAAKLTNVKALVLGTELTSAPLFINDNTDHTTQLTNCDSFMSYAAFMESNISSFTVANGWTIDETGITFGTHKVLSV